MIILSLIIKMRFYFFRDRDEYGSNNGERSDKKRSSVEKHRRDRSRDKMSKHDRYSGGSGGHRSSKHQDRFRDRKR